MQISQCSKEELALLIHGLRAVHVSDMTSLRHKLAVQLETEMSTRFGLMVGTPDEQERRQWDGSAAHARVLNAEKRKSR